LCQGTVCESGRNESAIWIYAPVSKYLVRNSQSPRFLVLYVRNKSAIRVPVRYVNEWGLRTHEAMGSGGLQGSVDGDTRFGLPVAG